MNRGRHKTKKYPKECYNLRYFNTFKQVFTPKEAEILIQRIREYSEMFGYSNTRGLVFLQEWEKYPTNDNISKGFYWRNTKEGYDYWYNKIHNFINLKNKQNDRS